MGKFNACKNCGSRQLKITENGDAILCGGCGVYRPDIFEPFRAELKQEQSANAALQKRLGEALKDIQDAAGYAYPDIGVCAEEASIRVRELLYRAESAETNNDKLGKRLDATEKVMTERAKKFDALFDITSNWKQRATRAESKYDGLVGQLAEFQANKMEAIRRAEAAEARADDLQKQLAEVKGCASCGRSGIYWSRRQTSVTVTCGEYYQSSFRAGLGRGCVHWKPMLESKARAELL
jgi:hypothetical protein